MSAESDTTATGLLDARPPAQMLLGASLLHGLLLLALYHGVEVHMAFATHPWIATPLWTLALVLPVQFMLVVGSASIGRIAVGMAVSGAILLALAAWTGAQLEPHLEVSGGGVWVVYLVTMLVLAFKSQVWLWAWLGGRWPDYSLLLAASWRAFLLPGQALVFVGIFAAVMALWAGLFSLIGIEVFADLFQQYVVFVPVLTLAFGTGLLLFRRLPGLVGDLDARLRTVMMLLLPVVLLLALAFTASLPFTGVEPLWDTGYGSALLLWLLAVSLFFLNAVYQPGTPEPYPALLARGIGPALLVLPIIAILAGWGLYIRIDAYGWTVDRFWALVVWALLAGYALACAALVLLQRARWRGSLGRVNVVMSLVLVAVLVLANSPLLDPRALSVASQLARVERGELAPVDLDFRYFRYALGRPGHLALERLREQHADDERLLALIDGRVAQPRLAPSQRLAMMRDLRRIPEHLEIPPEVVERLGFEGRLRDGEQRWLIGVDLDRDQQEDDYVYVMLRGPDVSGYVFLMRPDGLEVRSLRLDYTPGMADELRAALAAADVRLVRPALDEVMLGGIRIGAH